jgi:hypothetical protein
MKKEKIENCPVHFAKGQRGLSDDGKVVSAPCRCGYHSREAARPSTFNRLAV